MPDKYNESQSHEFSLIAYMKKSPIISLGSLSVLLIGSLLFALGSVYQAEHGLASEILKGCGIGITAFGMTSFIQSAILAKSATEQLEQVRRLLSRKLDGVLDESKNQLERMGNILTDIQLEQFTQLKERLNPQLNKVFLEFAREWIDKVHAAAKRQEIVLEGAGVDLFRHFYRRTLQAFPKRRFLATSLPSRNYFWKDNQTLNHAMAKFIKEGGKIERIFFFDKEPDTEISDEQTAVIEEQLDMGVLVYVVHGPSVPKDLKKYFVTEERGSIAWEVFAHLEEIVKVVATSNRNITEGYKKTYCELKDRASEVQSVSKNPNRLILSNKTL